MPEKILAINPGSTSTKIALFDGDEILYKVTVPHDAQELSKFPTTASQLPYRRETILSALHEAGVDLSGCVAFSGRGGGLQSCEGGTYEVNAAMLQHAKSGKYGGDHPAALGCQLAHEFAEQYGARAFVVNPPDTDELCQEARITGLAGVYRTASTHALNQKETAIRVCRQDGRDYHSSNLIVVHLGGGVSITAHQNGRMIDSNGIVNGEGPMAPTRIGTIPVKTVLSLLCSGQKTTEDFLSLLTKTGGFVDHLGTSDMLEVKRRIDEGDEYARIVYHAFVYQIAKEIGAMAAVLCGKVDALIFTGGIAHDETLVALLKERVGFIAPIKVCAGEFEMEALAAGALRVLRGEETAKVYTGIPPFTGLLPIRRGDPQDRERT